MTIFDDRIKEMMRVTIPFGRRGDGEVSRKHLILVSLGKWIAEGTTYFVDRTGKRVHVNFQPHWNIEWNISDEFFRRLVDECFGRSPLRKR